jgi:hypothetical protein
MPSPFYSVLSKMERKGKGRKEKVKKENGKEKRN